MKLSAEIRWFWSEEPSALFDWFQASRAHGCIAGGGLEPRVDEYLIDPGQVELGVKHRGSAAGKAPKGPEIKGLIAARALRCELVPFVGDIELWGKWESGALVIPPHQRCRVDKTRWLRKFSTAGTKPVEIALDGDEQPIRGGLPAEGCNVEATKITVDGSTEWWTFGFESFGGNHLAEAVIAVAAELIGRGGAPALGGARPESYPSWLSRLAFH
jgi:hypothetical protein